jgi:thymidylate synthase
MTEWDKEYIKLCKKILKDGVETENRTGINTIAIPHYELTFDLRKEFPILTTKQLFSRQAIIEMLWIWQMSSNNVKELQDRNVHIWDEWMVDEDGIYRIYEPYGNPDPDRKVEVMDPLSLPITDPFGKFTKIKPKLNEDGSVMMAESKIKGKTIKYAKYFGKEYANTIGTAYGFITGRYGFAENLINTIKNDPTDRRMIKSLWQDEFLRTAVLPSCVWSTEWDVTDGELSLLVHQRSCDVPLGLPFNVTQYATFLSMIAKVTGLKPATISYSIKNAHIYVNQIDGIKEQIKHANTYKRFSKMSREELMTLKGILEDKMNKVKEKDPKGFKDSKEYLLLESEYNTIDMILEPTKPELWLNPEVDNFFDYDNSKDCKDAKILNYKHMGKIKFDVAQ